MIPKPNNSTITKNIKYYQVKSNYISKRLYTMRKKDLSQGCKDGSLYANQ
jgi:hypothetical protein